MNFIEKFPWAKATIAVGVGGMALIVMVALFLLGFRQPFPSGYDGLLYSLVGMTGAGGLIGIGKRATDYTLAAVKTGDAAMVAAVVGPPKVENTDGAPDTPTIP
jgi:hypothetical protein